MSLQKPSEFKASQIYDWHSEPAEERGSSFFFDDPGHPAPTPRRAPVRGGPSSLSIGIVIVVMLGAAGLVALARLLQS